MDIGSDNGSDLGMSDGAPEVLAVIPRSFGSPERDHSGPAAGVWADELEELGLADACGSSISSCGSECNAEDAGQSIMEWVGGGAAMLRDTPSIANHM